MNKKETLQSISEQNLQFYFDGVRRDSLDSKRLDRKSAQCLLIREKLLRLPDDIYETTMSAIQALVDLASKDPTQEVVKEDSLQKKAAKQLYRQSQENRKTH